MDRISVYALLADELNRLQALPRQQVIDLTGKPPITTPVQIGDETISIEISVCWADSRQTKLRVAALGFGPSCWNQERMEETMILDFSADTDQK